MGATLINVPNAGTEHAALKHAVLEQTAHDGVVFVEEEFCRAGHEFEARASQLAVLLERYLEHKEQEHKDGAVCVKDIKYTAPLVSSLADVAARIRQAGFILEETCVAYVKAVNETDRSLSRDKIGAS
jgi:hypothetical protein